MGFILTILDEFLPIKPRKSQFSITKIDYDKKEFTSYYTLRYAIPNIILETIDCLVIPYFSYLILLSLLSDFTFLSLLKLILPLFSSLFSLFQVFNHFFNPTENYINLWSRFLSETALGCFLSAIFRLRFKTKFPE